MLDKSRRATIERYMEQSHISTDNAKHMLWEVLYAYDEVMEKIKDPDCHCLESHPQICTAEDGGCGCVCHDDYRQLTEESS